MRRLPFSIDILERSLADWVGKVGLDTAAEHLRRHFGVPRCFEASGRGCNRGQRDRSL